MPKRKERFAKERPLDPRDAEAPWRLFVALPLPPPATELVGALVRSLGNEGWPVRWVDPNTAHITLQFIGEVEPARGELLRMALPRVIAGHAAFDLRTADLGVFPNRRQPRIVWLGLHGPTHRLQALYEDVTRLLVELELPHDDREFHPHITLGRLRDVQNQPVRDLPAKIANRLDAEAETGLASAKAPRPVPVGEVHLVRSFLGKDGARHETIGRFSLGE
ncbi:MAG: 2'-5' RNA ligase [uncultured Thermomicrobiales bacterium]|uniref:RNA 2',3'-cyclic phosphodiesterase n=1 Tax=uncultured Thermomicrobiales bacterium TaxID=1645740 RepID=A0A6J4UQ78_9BACT|nr:MAG: 2'-5' RNA ligase [uncultured Thermomicrobiales bacterium]